MDDFDGATAMVAPPPDKAAPTSYLLQLSQHRADREPARPPRQPSAQHHRGTRTLQRPRRRPGDPISLGSAVDGARATTQELPWHTTGLQHRQRRTLAKSAKLQDVVYEIRGPAYDLAARLEAQGHRILKLNIGNPATFGFEAPDAIMSDIIQALPYAQGYSDSQGILSARRAVVTHYELVPGFPRFDVEDVYLGNGVSELITMTLQALLDNGDQVLIPAPDYPLWTAATSLAGGTPVHYLCDETQGWIPDIEDLEAKITERTKALVIINPNNPTGAVYSHEIITQIVDLARRHQLLLLSDEIYDKILYDGAEYVSTASVAPDLLCLTFNGLSKAYRLAGYRGGWLVITGPKEYATGFLHGINLLANMRLCPNVPAQQAIQVALGSQHRVEDLVLPGGRLLEQRDVAWSKLNDIPGVSCVKPQGALYAYPRLDPEVYDIHDDAQLVLDLLLSEKILVTQGTGFNWPTPDHLRLVTLAWPRDLATAIERLGNFLTSYRQERGSRSHGVENCDLSRPSGRRYPPRI